MFFLISKIEQEAHYTEGLENPKNPGNPMVFGIYRTRSRIAFFTVYSKKAFGEFWDDTARKKIPNRFWTAEMKTFAKQKIAAAPQPPFIFKFTIAGWILLLFAIGLLGYLVYDGIQAPARTKKYEQRIAEQTKINVGDIYLGRMTMYREKGVLIGSKKEFGWFKIVKKENDTYHLVKSIEMINAPKITGNR
ncbi:hypothetical protein [Empedobacter brevis]|uniref:hypothetical protein n=1 Tax=Empedobacter brevis TaxID=247 RepID=UPI002FE42272